MVVYSLLVLLAATVTMCHCASVGVLHKDDADGERLIALGAHINDTSLQLVGHAFANLEEDVVNELCHKSPCELFTAWSACTATNILAFGYQTRSRKCFYERTSDCAMDGKATVEKEARICKGNEAGDEPEEDPEVMFTCPSEYTVSDNGFCVKFYDKEVAQDEAENTCQGDDSESHVMNPDTEERWDDFTAIVNASQTAEIWLDGFKPTVDGTEVNFKSGVDFGSSNYTTFSWDSDFDLYHCRSTKPFMGKYMLYETNCTVSLPFLCEIRP